MGFDVTRRRGPAPVINVTPLVDVVLVLLIIFMVVIPMADERLGVALPTQRMAAAPEDVPEQLLLDLRADGTVYLDGEPVAREALRAALRRRLASGRPPVFFRAERDALYRDAVAILDVARGAGATSIGTVLSGSREDGR